jgi:uncharacterized protein YecT (DUF1311 family)
MENLQVAQESFLTFRDKTTGKIMAIEDQNGSLHRYECIEMNNGGSQELFGVKISGNPSKL